MYNKKIILAKLRINSDIEQKFNDFYNKEHIPHLEKLFPQFENARRYLSIKETDKHFITIYELKDQKVFEEVKKTIHVPGREGRAEWNEWEDKYIDDIARLNYDCIFDDSSEKQISPGPILIVKARVHSEYEKEFNDWYNNHHIGNIKKSFPVSFARRFSSCVPEDRHFLTIYYFKTIEELRETQKITSNKSRAEKIEWDSIKHKFLIEYSSCFYNCIYP